MNPEYYVNLVGEAGQYICPICGCVTDEYEMTIEKYAARLARWSKRDNETQIKQIESVLRFAYQGQIGLNTRCYDTYFDDPVIDLDASAQIAWKRRNMPKERFLAKVHKAADFYKKTNSFRAFRLVGAYIDVWDFNHP